MGTLFIQSGYFMHNAHKHFKIKIRAVFSHNVSQTFVLDVCVWLRPASYLLNIFAN